jgi:hypothetical protein
MQKQQIICLLTQFASHRINNLLQKELVIMATKFAHNCWEMNRSIFIEYSPASIVREPVLDSGGEKI